MAEVPQTRARQAELTAAQKRTLQHAQMAVDKAVRSADLKREAFADTAAQIALDLGRGGASAVARHFGWTPQYVSALVAAYKAKQAPREGSAAA